MKRFNLILVFALALVIPLSALAAPGIPHQFYGNATYTNGTAISSGNVIVKIGATQVATVPISNGRYGYNPNLLLITDADSNRAGSTLKFFIGTVDTGKTEVFVNGGYTNLNLDTLVAPTATPTPSPTPTGGSSGGGTSGGGGGAQPASTSTTPSPTPTPLPALSPAAQKVDANKDNKIDVLDFNSLMVNWGKTGTGNVADFDGDGKVDIFDFNSLMINWTK